MAEASRHIFKDRLELRTDAKIFIDRYTDERGQAMWETVTKLAETSGNVTESVQRESIGVRVMIVDTLKRCAEYAQTWCMDAPPLYYYTYIIYSSSSFPYWG